MGFSLYIVLLSSVHCIFISYQMPVLCSFIFCNLYFYHVSKFVKSKVCLNDIDIFSNRSYKKLKRILIFKAGQSRSYTYMYDDETVVRILQRCLTIK